METQKKVQNDKLQISSFTCIIYINYTFMPESILLSFIHYRAYKAEEHTTY